MMQADSVLFHEKQYFRKLWIILIVFGVASLMWVGFVQQIILGQPFGDNPGPDWFVILFTLLFGIGLPLLWLFMRLEVRVRPDEVDIHFWPFLRRRIPVAAIESVEARTYKPIREYGGWGIRWGLGKGIAYSVSGNRGVQLAVTQGRSPVMIGSRRADKLAAAIEKARGQAAGAGHSPG